MAKKDSIPLTPEELAAKNERKAEKRKIFGDTFLKALAVVLAIVFVYSVVYVAFGQGMTVIQKVNSTGAVASGSGSSSGSSHDLGASLSGSADAPASSTGDDSSNTASAGSDASSSAGAATSGATDAAAVAKAINDATAAAVNAKAGHDWERHCQVKDIDVGKITDFLNGIIGKISEGDDVNSVVGGFLGNGDKKETIAKGTVLTDIKESDGKDYYHGTNYMLKATQLKAEDIKNLQVNGDTYTFELPDCENPDRSGNTALSRFTGDIVVREEVEAEIKDYTSAVSIPSLNAKYSKIKCSVTIKDGKLTELTYSLYGEAALDVKVAIATVTGTGNLTTTAKYSNFKY